MQFDNKKIQRIIAHDGCPDGIFAAALVKLACPHASVEFYHYGTKATKDMSVSPGMCFVDFSPPAERADEFLKAGALVLDHHIGQRDLTRRFEQQGLGVYSADLSGAAIASKVFFQNLSWSSTISDIAELISIRDTWKTTDPRWQKACAISSAVAFLGFERTLECLKNHNFSILTTIGNCCQERRGRDIKRAIDNLVYERSDNLSYAIFEDARGTISDVAEELRSNNTELDFVCGFFYAKDTASSPLKVCFSLRSLRLPGIALQIAKANGGGGHADAAGCNLQSPDVLSASPIALFRLLLS